MKKRALIFGHSHVWSVKRALTGAPAHPGVGFEVILCGTKQFPGNLVARSLPGKIVLNPVLVAALEAAAIDRTNGATWLVSLVQGNHYNQFGMLAEGTGFDFVLPAAPQLPLDPAAVLLPVGAVSAGLWAHMEEFEHFLPILAKIARPGRAVVVGPPPPTREDDLIRDFADKTFAPEIRRGQVISAAFTRLKLWTLQNTLVEALCRKHGVLYQRGDVAGTQDADGFLLRVHAKDAVHADHLYSAKLLAALADRIATERE